MDQWDITIIQLTMGPSPESVLNLHKTGMVTSIPVIARKYGAITTFASAPSDEWSMFGPFEPLLRGIILIAMVIIGLVAALIEWLTPRLDPEADQEEVEKLEKPSLACAYSAINFISPQCGPTLRRYEIYYTL